MTSSFSPMTSSFDLMTSSFSPMTSSFGSMTSLFDLMTSSSGSMTSVFTWGSPWLSGVLPGDHKQRSRELCVSFRASVGQRLEDHHRHRPQRDRLRHPGGGQTAHPGGQRSGWFTLLVCAFVWVDINCVCVCEYELYMCLCVRACARVREY